MKLANMLEPAKGNKPPDAEKLRQFIEAARNLPENYLNMLIGAAFALEMSSGIETRLATEPERRAI